jgi:predicted nucleic acid-binding protein
MAMIDLPPIVCNTGPIIHLDELGCLDLLKDLGTILIPREVWNEATSHRPQLTIRDLPSANIVDIFTEPSARLLSLSKALDLDIGERAAIALMEGVSAKMLLCDDAAARLAAESLGFVVRGTIGIIVRSIRTSARTRQQVVYLLRELPIKSSLHLSRQLLEAVIMEVQRASKNLKE